MAEEVAREVTRLFRVRKTVCKMLVDRGYLVSQNEHEMTIDAFRDKFTLPESETLDRQRLTILVSKRDDPSDQIFVFFPVDAKVGVKPIHEICKHLNEQNVSRAIVVVQQGLTPFARSAMMAMNDKYKLEQFLEAELLVNITEHALVPQHVVLTDEETQALLKRYKLKEAQLPRIQLTDPVARYYGMQRGQVVKIIRPSETAGRYVTYRYVM